MKRSTRGKIINIKYFYFVVPLFVIFILAPFCLSAEDPAKYPSKPITLIVPVAPGGMFDSVCRKLADLAGSMMGQAIVVVNKPGGGQIIGTAAIAAAAPDGYTIGVATFAPLAVTPHTRAVPYKTKDDFTYIMSYGKMTMFFCVHSESRWKTFKEFVEEARRSPNKLTYSTVGTMGAQHIFMEYIFSKEKVKVTHVPYDAAEIVTNLMGGHVDSGFAVLLPWVQGGKLRALAIQEEKRVEAIPDVPIFSDLGYGDEVKAPLWIGFCGPKGLDSRILNKLNDVFKKCSEDPTFKELCVKWSIVPSYKDPESFRTIIHKDYDVQRNMLKELGFIK